MEALFLNYPGGASGHLILKIIAILSRDHIPAPRDTYFHLHFDQEQDSDLILDHAYLTDPALNLNYGLEKYCSGITTQEGVNWFKNNFTVTKAKKHKFYIYQHHEVNPEPIISNFPSAKLIYVRVPEKLHLQVCFNFVEKLYPNLPDKGAETTQKNLQIVQAVYQKLLDCTSVDLTNKRLITWLHWAATLDAISRRNSIIFSNIINCLYIDYTEILNKDLLNRLEYLSEFLDCRFPDNNKYQIIAKLLTAYLAAQATVPWEFSLEDYP